MRFSPCAGALVVSMLSSAALAVAEQEGTVTVAVNLRAGPSTQTARAALLEPGLKVVLIETTPRANFYHVRTPTNRVGWVWAPAVKLATAVSKARELVRRAASPELEPHIAGVLASACAPDLESCPDSGCASPDSDHGLANRLKRTPPSGENPIPLTFDDFSSLQAQADVLVGQDQELSSSERATLRGLTVEAGQVSEGSLVSLVGYLVGVPHPNTGESVNCNLRGEASNDYHIPMSYDANNRDFEGIVVEMIPQGRPSDWSLASLTIAENAQRLVMVTGALFYDNLHLVNSDPGQTKRGQPHRYSLWEIHAVVGFVVCGNLDNTCDPAQPGDWIPLGAVV